MAWRWKSDQKSSKCNEERECGKRFGYADTSEAFEIVSG
jgi:hypothetical protein